MFRLTMHPASEGDCLVLAWGSKTEPHHALIDLGRQGDFKRLRPRLEQGHRIDLFAISHIDADHIAGAMPMYKKPAPFAPADVWFNGFAHLAAAKARRDSLEAFSVDQGNKLEIIIRDNGWPWNVAFGGGPVSVDSSNGLVARDLPGGLRVTLLSPTDEKLATLHKDWEKWLRKEGLLPDDPEDAAPAKLEIMGHQDINPRHIDVDALAARRLTEDDEPPNGSSIALLAEFEGKRVLLGADAHPSCVVATLERLGFSAANRLKLDLCKLCHHGSAANTSPGLLSLIDCARFALSTDGSHHGHPDAEAIARVLMNDPTRNKVFYFNNLHPQAKIWDDRELKAEWRYSCTYPNPPINCGLTIDI